MLEQYQNNECYKVLLLVYELLSINKEDMGFRICNNLTNDVLSHNIRLSAVYARDSTAT